MMRSLFGKITLWSLVAIALALVGVRQIGTYVYGRNGRDNLRVELARLAYEAGGSKRLEDYFAGRTPRPATASRCATPPPEPRPATTRSIAPEIPAALQPASPIPSVWIPRPAA